ncbi:MAG: cell wall hydrolase [Lachnospiraceae bacterium]|nr:cell wall hydrolase [Lachnospiraceae bacterium]
MKRFTVKLINFIVSLSLCGVFVFSSAGSIFADTTSEKLQKAEEEKKQTETQLNATQGQIDSLENSKDYLEDNLDDLNSKMTEISDSISKLEEEERTLEEKKARTEEELNEAKEKCKSHYAALKARIKTMYERGNESVFDILARSGSFSAFLNRTEYVEKVHDYDQLMLERYKNLEAEIEQKNEELQRELEELAEIQQQTADKQNEIKGAIDDTRSSITAYAGAIDDAEREALAIEQRIIEQNSTIAALRTQLQKEEELARQSQQMAKRSLSEVTFSGGDRELLGALIQCEAGGEPYAGKIAVGAVVMNRVMSGAFPNTIVGVIYQPGQFEPVSSGRLAIRLSLGANEECLRAADEAMSGVNNIGECLFFRTVVPGIKGTVIGHHVFYLYWTGKYTGYGTAEETLETAKPPEEEEEEEETVEDSSSSDDSSDDSSNEDDDSDSEEDENDEDNSEDDEE